MKMIKIITTNGEHKLFQNYHQFCGYINDIEKEKWKASKSGERNWMFIRRPHQTLAALYHRSQSLRASFTHKEKEAIEKE